MTAMAVAQRMTAEEFIAAPEPLNRRPWNLVDGEVVMNDPTVLHGMAQGAIFVALSNWTRADSGRGNAQWPCDIQLDDRNVYVPDILWYPEDRMLDISKTPPYPLPDIAGEIRSPSSWRYDTGRKKAIYEAAGLPELWLVDTASSTLLVFRRSRPEIPAFDTALELDRSQRLTSPLLPGFELAVSEIFPADD